MLVILFVQVLVNMNFVIALVYVVLICFQMMRHLVLGSTVVLVLILNVREGIVQVVDGVCLNILNRQVIFIPPLEE